MTTPPKPATVDDKVVALGRLIEDVGRRVESLSDQIERRFAEQASDVDHARTVAQQATASAKNALDLIVDVSAQLAAGQEDEKQERKRPINPLLIRDPDEALQVLTDLHDWLRAVYIRYEGSGDSPAPVVSDCWAWHTGAVTELYALYRMWLEAYQGPKASDRSVADWHDRYRPATVRRVNAVLQDCRPDKHVDSMRYRPPSVHGDELLTDLAEWMVHGSQGQEPPPAPTPDMVTASRNRRN